MGKWTRRDLVKAGLAASAGVMTGKDLLAEPRGSRLAAAAPIFAQMGANLPGVNGPNTLRERLLLDFGWRFALGNAADPAKDFGYGKLSGEGLFAKAGHANGPASPRFDDSAWSKIDLPHDWALDLPFVDNPTLVGHGAKPLGREYPETSIGWYRREFVLPASDAGRRISVEFDGIFRNATVFFNGHYIAENMSGYAPLDLDLTDFANFADKAAMDRAAADQARIAKAGTDAAAVARIKAGMQAPGLNVLVVRVDATLDEGWFYEGAGIYRHAWLTKTAPVHIARWGNYVRSDFGAVTGVVTHADQVTVHLSTEVINDSDVDVVGRVHAALVDDAGKTVATAVSDPATIEARDATTFVLHTTVWHPEHLVARLAEYVSRGDHGRGGRRHGRSGHGDVWHSHRALRCGQGVLPQRQAGEDQGDLQPPGPRGRGRGHPGPHSGLPAGAAAMDGLERLPHLAQSADAGVSGRLRPHGNAGDGRDAHDVVQPGGDERAGAADQARPQPSLRGSLVAGQRGAGAGKRRAARAS